LPNNYINSHGKDLHGKSLGQYFIHGLGHHIGLNVHDPGEYCAPFQPGMVITIEPGIYIPEENLGVRIEDDVLITESGYKLLSERLPRDPLKSKRSWLPRPSSAPRGPRKATTIDRQERAHLYCCFALDTFFSSSVPRVIPDVAVFLARLNFRNSQSF